MQMSMVNKARTASILKRGSDTTALHYGSKTWDAFAKEKFEWMNFTTIESMVLEH